jgi:prepilin-type N-terminal cleavage/methylation domain-containing protein/prepilin-type processing-associated H-X9-DG protein
MKKKAFTLVELLVVISIIALLIALLIPSLSAAKDVVRTTYCRSTINALNKSVFVYAENSRGFMMVYQHHIYSSKTTGSYASAPENPWKTYACFQGGNIDPNTGVFADARGFGIVYAEKLLAPAEMFYCPDPNPRDQRQNIDHYGKPWGTQVASDSGYIRNSYMWNPWIMQNPAKSGHGAYEDSLMLSRHDNARFLTSDLLDDARSMRHMTTTSGRWNMGFADGHVFTFESARDSNGNYQTLYELMMDGPPADGQFRTSENLFWAGGPQSYNATVRTKLPQ